MPSPTAADPTALLDAETGSQGSGSIGREFEHALPELENKSLLDEARSLIGKQRAQ